MRRTLNKVAFSVIAVSGAILAVPYIMDAVAPQVVATQLGSHAKVEAVSTSWFRPTQARGNSWQDKDANTIASADNTEVGGSISSAPSITIEGFTKDITVSKEGACDFWNEVAQQMQQKGSKTKLSHATFTIKDKSRDVSYVIQVLSGSWDSTADGQSDLELSAKLMPLAGETGAEAGTISIVASLSQEESARPITKGHIELSGIESEALLSLLRVLVPFQKDTRTSIAQWTGSLEEKIASSDDGSRCNASLIWHTDEPAAWIDKAVFTLPLRAVEGQTLTAEQREMTALFTDWTFPYMPEGAELTRENAPTQTGKVELSFSGAYAKAARIANQSADWGEAFNRIPFADKLHINEMLKKLPFKPSNLLGKGQAGEQAEAAFWAYLTLGSTTDAKITEQIGPVCAQQLKDLGDQLYDSIWKANFEVTAIPSGIRAQLGKGPLNTVLGNAYMDVRGDVELGGLHFTGCELSANFLDVFHNQELRDFLSKWHVREANLSYHITMGGDKPWGPTALAAFLKREIPELKALLVATPLINFLLPDPAVEAVLTYEAGAPSEAAALWEGARKILETQNLTKSMRLAWGVESIRLGQTELASGVSAEINPLDQDGMASDIACGAKIDKINIPAVLSQAKPILAFRALNQLEAQKAILPATKDGSNYIDTVLFPAWEKAAKKFQPYTGSVILRRQAEGGHSFEVRDNGTNWDASIHLDRSSWLGKARDWLERESLLDLAPGGLPITVKDTVYPKSKTPSDAKAALGKTRISSSLKVVESDPYRITLFMPDWATKLGKDGKPYTYSFSLNEGDKPGVALDIQGPHGSLSLKAEEPAGEDSALMHIAAKDVKGVDLGVFSYQKGETGEKAKGDNINFARLAKFVQDYPLQSLDGFLLDLENDDRFEVPALKLPLAALRLGLSRINSKLDTLGIFGTAVNFDWEVQVNTESKDRHVTASLHDPKGFNLDHFEGITNHKARSYTETASSLTHGDTKIFASAEFTQEGGKVTGKLVDFDVEAYTDLVGVPSVLSLNPAATIHNLADKVANAMDEGQLPELLPLFQDLLGAKPIKKKLLKQSSEPTASEDAEYDSLTSLFHQGSAHLKNLLKSEDAPRKQVFATYTFAQESLANGGVALRITRNDGVTATASAIEAEPRPLLKKLLTAVQREFAGK